MGFNELQPLSKHGVDGLGGLGAIVIDALDIAMIMGLSIIVKDAGSWIKKELPTQTK
jgi:mannosyl-oligosaccharide alpha-1,2-mannosidase